MKRNLLITLAMLLLGVFHASATSVIINVDKAANVVIKTNYGYGRTIDELTDGMNRLDLSDTDDSPLQIVAAEGAEIVSVMKNETEEITASNGSYTVRFYSAGIKIDIVTREGGSTPVARDVAFSAYAMGTGISGSPFTMQYEKDGEWSDVGKDNFGMYAVPENSAVKVSPVSPYTLESLTFRNGDAIETTRTDDGALTFVCAYDKFYYQAIYVNMGVSENAIRFSITVDYAPNLSAFLENQREEGKPWISLDLKDGKNNFVCLPENTPLGFFETTGASIVAVTRNGEPASPTGWGGSNGWVFEPLEDGDDFVVTTQGKEVDVELVAGEGYASLDNYFFKNADGKEYKASGMNYMIKVHAGETIYVSPRPGTAMTYIMHSNGGNSNMLDNFRVAEGADGVNPMKVTVYGTRNVNGVVINVDDDTRVQVIQEGGRGDVLALHKGKNEFALADIKNALAISAAEGNQMVSVTKNGDAVAPNANGVYLVNAEEGNWIELVSRKNPVDVTLNFSLNEGADISWLKGSVDGQTATLALPVIIKTYAPISISANDGYILESLTCATPGVELSNDVAAKTYTLTVSDANITTLDVNVVVKEMEPEEGNAVVIPNGDEILVTYREYSKNESGEYTFVKRLANNTVNQVALGNYVQAYCKDTQSRFSFVKANGVQVEYEAGSDDRIAYVKIDGRTVIEAEIHTPCQAYTQETFDDVKHVVAGTVYFDVNGSKETLIYPEAGQTVKFIPAPEKGYLFEHIELFYSLTFAADGIKLDGLDYTFTEQDVKENYILFKAVFRENPDEKSYAVRGSTAWLKDADGNINVGVQGAKGTVVFQDNEGKYVREITGLEGETVKLFVSVTDEAEQDKYIVDSYCFMQGFPDNKIQGSQYDINAKDADNEGVIWISAIVKEKGPGVGVDTPADVMAISYDSDSQMVRAKGAVRIFSVSGNMVLSADENEVSVAQLPAGVYIVVSENENIKFVK